MFNKKKKKRIIFMTILSAVLYSAIVIATSLSSLADTSDAANKFGTVGMWMALGMILLFYIIPLAIYAAGLNAMRFVMAVFCAIGILTHVVTLLAALGVSAITVVALSAVAIVVNVLWFVVAFRGKNQSYGYNI